MNKIYLSDNYIIVEKGSSIKAFPKNNSDYDEAIDHFTIRKFPNKHVELFPFSELNNWFDESGTIPYTINSLRTLLRQNTGFDRASVSRGAEFIKQTAQTYSQLLDGELVGDVAYVKASEGTKWLPGTVGGTYYPAGWYQWNGTEWFSDRNAIAIQFDLNQTALDNKAEQADLLAEIQNRVDEDIAINAEIDLIVEDKFFELMVSTPSINIAVPHNLDKYPSIHLIDSAGSVWIADILHIDKNNAVMQNVIPLSGRIIAN